MTDIANVVTAHIGPEDTIILETEANLTPEQLRNLRSQVKERFPNNEVLILHGFRLGVARVSL